MSSDSNYMQHEPDIKMENSNVEGVPLDKPQKSNLFKNSISNSKTANDESLEEMYDIVEHEGTVGKTVEGPKSTQRMISRGDTQIDPDHLAKDEVTKADRMTIESVESSDESDVKETTIKRETITRGTTKGGH